MSICPCGSGVAFDTCCEPLLERRQQAVTAEALMRSRYTAFTRIDMDYVQRSHHPKTRSVLDMKGTEKWAKAAEWLGLEIIDVKDGGAGDNSGEVEFKARYRLHGELCTLHERSTFERKQGEWYYVDSTVPEIRQYRREAPKLGRNDPCSCGSGKKFKKCCALA